MAEHGLSLMPATILVCLFLHAGGKAVNANFLRLFACAVTLQLSCGAATGQSLKIETIHGPPWGFIGSDGKATGMMYEIGNLIAREAGFNYTNALAPYARTAIDIENGSADIVLRFENEQMTRGAVAVATIVAMPIIVLGPGGTHFNSLSDLHGKTVGYVRTSKYVPEFDTSTAIVKYAVNDYQVMARMLAMRRLDGGIGSSVGLYYGAHMAGVKKEQLGDPLVLGHNEFILFMSKKTARPETIAALRDAVKKLAASGEIKRIMDRYTGELTVKLP